MSSLSGVRQQPRLGRFGVAVIFGSLVGCGGTAEQPEALSSRPEALVHDGTVITTQPLWCGRYTGSADFPYSNGAYDPYSGDSLLTSPTHSEVAAFPAPAVVQDFVNETCPVGAPDTCGASDDLSNLDITAGTLTLSSGRAEIDALSSPFRAVFDVNAPDDAAKDLRWESQSVRVRLKVVSVSQAGGQVVLFGRYNTEYDLYDGIFRFNSDGSVDARLKRKLCGFYMGVPDDAWVHVPHLGGWSQWPALELRFDIERDEQQRWWLKLFARSTATVPWGSAVVAQRVATINGLPAFSTYGGEVPAGFELPPATAGLRLDTIKTSIDWLRLDAP